jgi:hypothetical protein
MNNVSGLTGRELLEHETAEALVHDYYGMPPTTDGERRKLAKKYQTIRSVLPQCGPVMLQRFSTVESIGLGYKQSLADFLCEPNANIEFINDLLTFSPAVGDCLMYEEPFVLGLSRYEHLVPYEGGECPVQRFEQTVAIARVTAYLVDNFRGNKSMIKTDGEAAFIEDKTLRDLITTHDDPSLVADIITQRGITDTDKIIAVYKTMRSVPNAIHEGVL